MTKDNIDEVDKATMSRVLRSGKFFDRAIKATLNKGFLTEKQMKGLYNSVNGLSESVTDAMNNHGDKYGEKQMEVLQALAAQLAAALSAISDKFKSAFGSDLKDDKPEVGAQPSPASP